MIMYYSAYTRNIFVDRSIHRHVTMWQTEGDTLENFDRACGGRTSAGELKKTQPHKAITTFGLRTRERERESFA